MKKILPIILVMVLCFAAFVSCGKKPNSEQVEDDYIKVVISAETEVEHLVKLDENNTKNGLLSILDYLQIEYEFDQGDFLRLGALESNFTDLENLKIITIYSSLEENDDKTEYSDSLTYKNTSLTKIGVLPTNVAIKKDAIFYIKEVAL